MRIVNGKKFYAKDIDAAISLSCDGWDTCYGQNYQWYTLKYNPNCGLVILHASNSGSCFGDYEDRSFSSPAQFARWARDDYRDIDKLLGDIDESDNTLMQFVSALYPDRT